MMNRRRALLVIGAAAFAGVGQASSALVRLVRAGILEKQNAFANSAPQLSRGADDDDRLRKDLARLDSRVNSEEGVPVFLGCINLVPTQRTPATTFAPVPTFNAAIVAEFRRTVAAWERIRPISKESDVAHVVEVLAFRDFARGGEEHQS